MSNGTRTAHVISHSLIIGGVLLLLASYLLAQPPNGLTSPDNSGPAPQEFFYTPLGDPYSGYVANLMFLGGVAVGSFLNGWRWPWLASVVGVAVSWVLCLLFAITVIPLAATLGLYHPRSWFDVSVLVGISTSLTLLAVAYLTTFLIKLTAIGPNRRRLPEAAT